MSDLMTLAGDPPAKLYGGISLITNAFAATTEPFPIVTPGIMTHPVQSHT